MQTDETKAREVLAHEYSRAGQPSVALAIRSGELGDDSPYAVPIRAMLAFAAPPAVERVEVVARALCTFAGTDPDEMVEAGDPIGNPAGYPAWMLAQPDARKLLAALSPTLHPSDREAIARAAASTERYIGKHGWSVLPDKLQAHLPDCWCKEYWLNIADAILALSGSLAPEGGEGAKLERQDAQTAMEMITEAATLADAQSIAATFLQGAL
jgi:hypothetical protein